MLLVFLISAAVTVFLLVIGLVTLLTAKDPTEARLMEISASAPVATTTPIIKAVPTTGLGRAASQLTGMASPVRALITGSDHDLEFKLTLAGFRKPEHVEIFTAAKLLLPVAGIVLGSFFSSNLLIAVAIGALAGFFVPDMILSYLVSRRQEEIRNALPNALDLLVICMEAGLGIDQAMVRVGEEMAITAPSLADEFQIINREQRAGKPRLEAWRSMAQRVDLEFVRQFVAMLVQTERFGTPIAHALGVFADSMRTRRTQAAEEEAAKTGVKLLFPLMLIFPSILVVTIGPAVLGLLKTLENLSK
jgi:tight adherence protein C